MQQTIQSRVFDFLGGGPNFLLFVVNARVIAYLIWQHYIRKKARRKRKLKTNDICRVTDQEEDNKRITQTQTTCTNAADDNAIVSTFGRRFHNQNQS